MKKLLFIFIITITFCSLVFGLKKINVNADTPVVDTTPSMKIVSNNVSYDDYLRLMYAVEVKNIDLADVKLLFWNSKQTNYLIDTEDYFTIASGETATISSKNYPIFYSLGIAPKNYVDKIYSRAYAVVDTVEYYSDVYEYSPLEYFYERLYNYTLNDSEHTYVTNDQKELYSAAINLTEKTQKVLNYKTDKLATQGYYVITEEGTFDNGKQQGFFFESDDVVVNIEDSINQSFYALDLPNIFDVVNYLGESDQVYNDEDYGEYKDGDFYLYTEDFHSVVVPNVDPYVYYIDDKNDVCGLYTYLDKYATELIIPAKIKGYDVNEIRSSFLRDLPNLESVTVDSNNKKYDSRNNCNAIIETATNTLISGYKNTVIPNDVTTIGSGSFSGSDGLSSVDLPSSVKTIQNYAFYSCDDLESINLNMVTSIGNSVFSQCEKLKNIYNSGNLETPGERAFSGCISLETINLGKITKLEEFTFDDCTSLESIDLNKITFLGQYAFSNCSSLTTVLNLKTTSIGQMCFQNCTKLETINLCNVTSLDKQVFDNCISLTSVDLSKMTSIGSNCFQNCSELTSVVLPSTMSAIADGTFRNCSKLSSVTIQTATVDDNLVGISTIGKNAFEGCSQLASFTIPQTVTHINDYAFMNCTSLTTIRIPISVSYVGDKAFFGCENIDKIYCEEIKSNIIVYPSVWNSGWNLKGYNTSGSYSHFKVVFDCNNSDEVFDYDSK